MDRRARITQFITRRQKGIEIGPYFAPLAPKRDGYNCLVLDVFDVASLQQHAHQDPNIAPTSVANIEEVDLIGTATEIAELIRARGELGTFDYVISSHNFEHLPDPIRFLQGCSEVLRPGGVLSMAIPDRRACFDYFRPCSTLADLLAAYFEHRTQPTAAQLFEQNSLHSRYGAQQALGFSLSDDPTAIVPLETLEAAFAEWQTQVANSDGVYRDCHCWTFTPASFELIVRDLNFLRVICWDIMSISKTYGNEFYVHLKNSTESHKIEANDFYRMRRQLLFRVIDEMSANAPQQVQAAMRQAETEAALAQERVQAAMRQSELEAARTQHNLSQAELTTTQRQLEALRNSTTWRLMEPLRRVGRLSPRLARLGRAFVTRRSASGRRSARSQEM